MFEYFRSTDEYKILGKISLPVSILSIIYYNWVLKLNLLGVVLILPLFFLYIIYNLGLFIPGTIGAIMLRKEIKSINTNIISDIGFLMWCYCTLYPIGLMLYIICLK